MDELSGEDSSRIHNPSPSILWFLSPQRRAGVKINPKHDSEPGEIELQRIKEWKGATFVISGMSRIPERIAQLSSHGESKPRSFGP